MPRGETLPDVAALFAPLADYQRVGIAVSGGPDSLALMLLAAEWAVQAVKPVQLVVYTVDHGLRPEAVAETDFVADVAEKAGLTVRVLRWDGDKPKSGLQAAARQARYRLIGSAMTEDGVEVLMTGHHAHDQAETVLMRLAHGSGLTGLGAMGAFGMVEGVRVFRPLLGIEPSSLHQLISAAGISAVADPSNTNADFERVRWRGVLPVLSGLGLDAGRFALFSKRARRADIALQQMAQEAFSRIGMSDGFGVIRIDRTAFAALAAELQVRVVRMALNAAGGAQKPFGLQQVEALVERFADPQARPQVTLMGCTITSGPLELLFLREPMRVSQETQQLGPGERLRWDRRFDIVNGPTGSVDIRSGADMTRQQAEKVLGQTVPVPMAAIHAAPVVRRTDGEIVAIGAMALDQSLNLRFLGSLAG